jgi:N6-L-threonylcarbamoyladenine synthase
LLILGIETSCDETAAAVVSSEGRVLSSIVSSQVATHASFGGVVPELASRRHVQDIIPVIRGALEAASADLKDLDGICVTVGPGLVGALMVGVAAAGAMAWAASVPAVGVNHIRGHLMAVFLRPRFGEGAEEVRKPGFPFVALVVSGGHTSLFLVRSAGDMDLLGRTRDDAAGEALDKGAKLLGLGYPGGPEIERCAGQWEGKSSFRFPRGLAGSKSLDFSFSGVKTALAVKVRGMDPREVLGRRCELCSAYQEAVVDVLVRKAIRACRESGTGNLVVAGGVASNSALRKEFHLQCADAGIDVFVPPRQFCTDNAAMIALAGEHKLARGIDETGSLRAAAWLGITDP